MTYFSHNVETMEPAASAYYDLVRQLPQPTIGQTIRFAWFVSGAHSWFKHLPLDSFVDFHFFIDPHAGMSTVRTSDGQLAFAEITNESTRFHYTWQTTDTYRRRFGYWRYVRSDSPGPRIGLLSGNQLQHTEIYGPSILAETGEWIEVPESLLAKGTAQVNAFVHRDTDTRHVEQLALLDRENDIDAAAMGDREHHFEKQVEQLLADVTSDNDEFADFKPILEDFGMLFDRDWESELVQAGAPNAQLLVAAEELQRQWLDLRCEKVLQLLKQMKGPDLRERLYALSFERDRQLTAMRTAMLRFEGAIYR